MQPFNYTLGGASPLESAMQGFQLGQNMQTQQAQRAAFGAQEQAALAKIQEQQKAAERKQAFDQRIAGLFGTEAKHSDLVSLYRDFPEMQESVTKAWSNISAPEAERTTNVLTNIYSALNNNAPDVAKKAITEEVARARNSGDPARIQQAEAFEKMTLTPQGLNVLKTNVGMALASRLGDKFASSFSTLAKAPAEAKRTEAIANAEPATLQANIDNIRSQIAERAARFGLDADKFNMEFDEKLNKLTSGNVTLSPGMEKMQAEAVASSVTASQMSNTAAQLAEAFKKEGRTGGFATWMAERGKEVAGFDGGVSALRREFVRLVNQGVLADLPPGPATDKDISTIRAGFPSENASAETIAKWLQSFSNVQKAAAMRDEAKSEWLSQVGNMSNAPRDLNIGGVQVAKGTSFAQFVRKGLGQNSQTEQTSEPGYLKYGRK